MPNPVWPGTLPIYVLEGGYNEQSAPNTVESEMDAGPKKSRRRYTATFERFGLSIACTADQAETFRTFWKSTCASGTIPFDWVHPRTRAAMTFYFRNPPPQYVVFGGTNVRISFTLESAIAT
jgi:hypothetical protein